MEHEKEIEQYEQDKKNFGKPWELWEFKRRNCDDWLPFESTPLWIPNVKYRRKADSPKLAFEPAVPDQI